MTPGFLIQNRSVTGSELLPFGNDFTARGIDDAQQISWIDESEIPQTPRPPASVKSTELDAYLQSYLDYPQSSPLGHPIR